MDAPVVSELITRRQHVDLNPLERVLHTSPQEPSMLEQDEVMHDSVKSRSLRVLFVGKAHLSHVGGAEMSTRYLAAALAKRGNHVGLLASVKRRSIQGLFATSPPTWTASVSADATAGTPITHTPTITASLVILRIVPPLSNCEARRIYRSARANANFRGPRSGGANGITASVTAAAQANTSGVDAW